MSNWVKGVGVANLLLTATLIAMAFIIWLQPGTAKNDPGRPAPEPGCDFRGLRLVESLGARIPEGGGRFRAGDKAADLWIKAANLCYEKALDYDCAAQGYLVAKSLGRDFSKDSESATRLVNSLANLGKTAQAEAWLNDFTSLTGTPSEGDTVAVRIGERGIMISELKSSLAREPEETKKNFEGPNGSQQYLNYYLFGRLLYQAALDTGVQDEKASETIAKFKENYLSELYYEKYFLDKIEVRKKKPGLYDNHPAEFKDASGKVKKFDEVKEDIAKKVRRDKALLMNDLWLKGQIEKRGIKINAAAFGSAK